MEEQVEQKDKIVYALLELESGETTVLPEGTTILGRKNLKNQNDKKCSRVQAEINVSSEESLVTLTFKGTNPMFLSRKGEPHDHFVKMKKDQVYQLNVGDIFSLVLLDYKYRLCAVSTFTGKREKTDDCYKPRCPYAAKCYRQSEDHFQEYWHPDDHPRLKQEALPSSPVKKQKTSEDGNDEMQSTADINQQMQTPLCEHNVPCVLRSVTKEGPTHGMKFFSCDKAGDAKCNFFQWVGAPLCKGHGVPCNLRHVRKDGPTQGRAFWCCSVNGADNCNYFKWIGADPKSPEKKKMIANSTKQQFDKFEQLRAQFEW